MDDSKKVVIGGIVYTTHYFSRLSKALYIHFIYSIILISITLIPEISIYVVALVKVLLFIPTTLIAITTHKIILEGSDSIPEKGLFTFGERERRFIGYGILVVILILPTIAFAFIPKIGIFIFFILASIIISRLSLIFPAIAIEKEMGLKESWDITSSHKMMMFSAVIVFPAVIGFAEYLIGLIPVLWIVAEFLSLLTSVLVVATLSVAYKIIFDEFNEG